jgi:hypothetical protein
MSPIVRYTGISLCCAFIVGCGTSGETTLLEGSQLAAGDSESLPGVAGIAAVRPSDSPATSSLKSLPLLRSQDLRRVGAFRLPDSWAAVSDGFSYGGRGVAFSPSGNRGAGSLILSGHVGYGRVGEVSIPVPSQDLRFADLPVATLLLPSQGGLIDPLEGSLSSSGIGGGSATTINGLLVVGDSLIVSAGNSYASTQPVTHWSRPLNLSRIGQVRGPATVVGGGGFSNPRFTAGYMCHVPDGAQAELGAPAITGWVADSIVSATSNGPAAFAFDPVAVSAGGSVISRPLLFYPHTAPLEESVIGASQQFWNWTSIPRGCAIPNGTRSILFIGRHGAGSFDYGRGGESGQSTEGQRRIYDPSDESTGEHAWPYRYQVWAYDILDLVAVRTGAVSPSGPRPYAVWTIELPFQDSAAGHNLEGMTFDPTTRRLYLVQANAGRFGQVAVHVFAVENAVSAAR